MKPGSNDIPAIKFGVLVGKNLEEKLDINIDNLSNNINCIVDFEQIDGLTFKQLLNLKPEMNDSDVIFFAYIDLAHPKANNFEIKSILCVTVNNLGNLKDSNDDISATIENYLIKNINTLKVRGNISSNDIVCTFLSRYMGKSDQEIDEKVRTRAMREFNKTAHHLW